MLVVNCLFRIYAEAIFLVWQINARPKQQGRNCSRDCAPAKAHQNTVNSHSSGNSFDRNETYPSDGFRHRLQTTPGINYEEKSIHWKDLSRSIIGHNKSQSDSANVAYCRRGLLRTCRRSSVLWGEDLICLLFYRFNYYH